MAIRAGYERGIPLEQQIADGLAAAFDFLHGREYRQKWRGGQKPADFGRQGTAVCCDDGNRQYCCGLYSFHAVFGKGREEMSLVILIVLVLGVGAGYLMPADVSSWIASPPICC